MTEADVQQTIYGLPANISQPRSVADGQYPATSGVFGDPSLPARDQLETDTQPTTSAEQVALGGLEKLVEDVGPQKYKAKPVDPKNTETSVHEPNMIQVLNGALTNENFSKQKIALEARWQANSALRALDENLRAEESTAVAINEAIIRGDLNEEQRLKQASDQLAAERKHFSQDDWRQLSDLNHAREIIDSQHSYELNVANPTVQTLLQLLAEAPGVQPASKVAAPFAEYDTTSDDSWQRINDQEVVDYLADRTFVTGQVIEAAVQEGTIIIRADQLDGFAIALDTVLGASTFASWLGRPAGNLQSWKTPYGDGEANSLEVMKRYAALPAEVPPVRVMYVSVQPDGKILCNNNNDSHRIAAAILQGRLAIKVNQLRFRRLRYNII